MEKYVTTNGVSANNFLQICRQLVLLEKKKIEEWEKASKAEQDIGKEVIRIREKMALDSAWVYNLNLKVMEKREPPEATI